MENDANEETGSKERVPHLRTILITVAVSSLSILRYLNLLSRLKLTIKMNENAQLDDLKKLHKVTQISYVAVGILSYVFYAWLLERCRRKTCLYFVCISQLATSILQLCTNSLWMLHVSKAFSAVSDVGAGMFCVIYVSEIAPDEIRGALVGIPELFITFSIFVTVSMNLLPVHVIYEYSSWISMYVSALVAIVTYAAVPESPIYFLRRDDITGAKYSMMVLRGNDKVSGVIDNRRKILKATRSDSQTTTSVFRECVSRRAVTFTFMITALYFSRTTHVYMERHLYSAVAYWYRMNFYYLSIITLSIKIFGNLLGIILCDRVGRKRLLLSSAFMCSISLIAIGIHIWFTNDNFRNKSPFFFSSAAALAFWFVYIFIFNLGITILPEVLITDIFPPKILNIQFAILGSFKLCINYAFLPIITKMEYPHEIYGEFWLYGGLAFAVALLAKIFLPETKCRPTGFKFMDSEERVLFSSLREEQ